MSNYPKNRPQLYAMKYIRWLMESGLVSETGADGFTLLVIVAMQEDQQRYKRHVNFWTEQLCQRCNVSRQTLVTIRSRLQKLGLLHYQSGARQRPGIYFTIGMELDSVQELDSIQSESNQYLITSIPIPNPNLNIFADWYSIFPKKVAKPAAEKAFNKAIAEIRKTNKVEESQAAELLMKWTRERVPELEERDPKFRPNPATWLNQTRYRDEIAGAVVESQSPVKAKPPVVAEAW
jgi:hypothetical protein